jgi:uncharacterized protein (DUF305 family)
MVSQPSPVSIETQEKYMAVHFVRRLMLATGLAIAAAFVLPARAQTMAPAVAAEAPFVTENNAAMGKMMADMNVKPSGDADRDFVAMMIPHHQGAIAMAQALLRYGHNEQLRRLAQEIIVTQQQEIAIMRLTIGELPVQSQPLPSADLKAVPDNNSMHMK